MPLFLFFGIRFSTSSFLLWYVQTRLKQAQLSVADRDTEVRRVVATIETDLQLLALTGVEDKLQVGYAFAHFVSKYGCCTKRCCPSFLDSSDCPFVSFIPLGLVC